jgi:hypothetical protein|nr:MAG TPA: transcriptional regulator, HTH_3 family, Transcriptional Regulaator, Strucutral.9A [Caudoviricetes sp.]
MAQEFNINRVIEYYKLDVNEVAEALFPNVRYKKLALDRVLKGEAAINTEQLQALAKIAGVLTSDLFNIDSWKGSAEDGCLTFLKGEYKAKLNYNGAWLSLYKNNELIKQEMFTPNMTLDEFIKHITELTINSNNN